MIIDLVCHTETIFRTLSVLGLLFLCHEQSSRSENYPTWTWSGSVVETRYGAGREDNDSYEIRDTLALSISAIPPASNMESYPDIVCKLVKDSLKVNISISDISASHRLNTKCANQWITKKDNIEKFCCRNTKLDFWSSVENLSLISSSLINFWPPEDKR